MHGDGQRARRRGVVTLVACDLREAQRDARVIHSAGRHFEIALVEARGLAPLVRREVVVAHRAQKRRLIGVELEGALQKRDATAAYLKLASTGRAVSALVAALRAHFPDSSGAKLQAIPTVPNDMAFSGPDGIAEAAPDWLPRLRDLLKQGDNEARELWDSKQEEIAGKFPFPLARRISIALQNFEFDVALQLLSK